MIIYLNYKMKSNNCTFDYKVKPSGIVYGELISTPPDITLSHLIEALRGILIIIQRVCPGHKRYHISRINIDFQLFLPPSKRKHKYNDIETDDNYLDGLTDKEKICVQLSAIFVKDCREINLDHLIPKHGGKYINTMENFVFMPITMNKQKANKSLHEFKDMINDSRARELIDEYISLI